MSINISAISGEDEKKNLLKLLGKNGILRLVHNHHHIVSSAKRLTSHSMTSTCNFGRGMRHSEPHSPNKRHNDRNKSWVKSRSVRACCIVVIWFPPTLLQK